MSRSKRSEMRPILLIEDNDDHAELIARLLDRVGGRVVRVVDGDEAMGYLAANSARDEPRGNPSLVLLDLRLPKMDGIAVLRQLKESDECRTTPVIVLSSSAEPCEVARAYANHANGYLVKPIDFDGFARMLEAVASYWLDWNEST